MNQNPVEFAEQLERELKRIRQLYDTANFLMKNDDAESSLVLGERIGALVADLLQELRSSGEYNRAFVDALLANRGPHFEKDLRFLNALAERRAGLSGVDVGEFRGVLGRTDAGIRLIARAVSTIFPTQNSWGRRFRRTLAQRKWNLFAGGSAIAVLFLATFVWKQMDLKKHSLIGEYFLDTELNDFYKKRNDGEINFLWGYGAPFLGFKKDQFSVRWTGYLAVDEPGEIQFEIEADDGVRLFINGQKLIENWTSHAVQKDVATIKIEKGFHPIRLEYFEDNANAEIAFRWKLPSYKLAKVIPAQHFYSQEQYLGDK